MDKKTILKELQVNYGYDFESDFFTDEIKTMVDDVIDICSMIHNIQIKYLTEQLSNKTDECNNYAANCNKYHDLYLSHQGENIQLKNQLAEKQRVIEHLHNHINNLTK